MAEPLHILILEDNPADAELIQFELSEAGLSFIPKVIVTGRDFVRELMECSPDLILSDYELPKYNGSLALAEAKRLCPDIPFILVSGAVSEDLAIDILTQGAKDYVLKNRLQQRLVPAVRRALAEAEEHRARRLAEAELHEANRTLEERVRLRTAELLEEITARTKMEKELRASEERYRSLFENAPVGVFFSTTEGKIIRVNAALARILGYNSPEEITAAVNHTSVDDVLYDKPGEREKLIGQARQTGGWVSAERRFRRKDGTLAFCTLAFRVLPESPHLLEGFIEDITERKEAEEALRESEEKFRVLANSSPTAIMLYQDDRWIYANRAAEQICGYPEQELLAMNFWDIVHPDFRAIVRERGQSRQQREETTNRYEFKIITKDGEERWVSLSGASTILHGRPAGIISVLDITDRKLAEEERREWQERLQRVEKMEALGTLAGGVAHDLNNVLGVVVGYAELLLDDANIPSAVQSSVAKIKKGGERAAAIVQDLLTLARRGVSSRQVLNLNQIVTGYLHSPELMQQPAWHDGIRIKTDLDPDLLNISGSLVHLRTTILNLIANACDAMPDGGVLTIKTANRYLDNPIRGYDEVREGDYVVLTVSDVGQGIPASDLKRIFEPFYTKKVMGRSGTGLGLAVVWGTVKDHSGYIDVESSTGKGTAFTLYFPVKREDLSTEQIPVSVSGYLGRGESILVVDDVEDQRELATAMLRKLNYRVESVASGDEAVACIRDHAVDLMVLDMIMDPGMDGLDTYRNIIAIRPGQKAIIVSGFSETERVYDAQALGAGPYVKKPYVLEKLGLAVRAELDRTA
jgi:PAS domain S-box-containing protein